MFLTVKTTSCALSATEHASARIRNRSTCPILIGIISDISIIMPGGQPRDPLVWGVGVKRKRGTHSIPAVYGAPYTANTRTWVGWPVPMTRCLRLEEVAVMEKELLPRPATA